MKSRFFQTYDIKKELFEMASINVIKKTKPANNKVNMQMRMTMNTTTNEIICKINELLFNMCKKYMYVVWVIYSGVR